MPISSSYGLKGKAQQPWNSTKSSRVSFSTQPTDAEVTFEKESLDSSHPRLNPPRKSSVGSRPAKAAGTNSLSKSLDSRKPTHTRTLSSRRPLKRRETSPEFQELKSQPLKAFKRSNSDSLIKPCSKRKVRKEIGSRRIRTFPRRRLNEAAFGTQNRAKKFKVNFFLLF